jgi:hypothetical protein
VFSPYTYSWKNFEEAKSDLFGRKNEFIAVGLMSAPLIFFFLSRRRVRVQRAKKEYYLNQMLKRKFIADELDLKPRKMRLNELKAILREQNN